MADRCRLRGLLWTWAAEPAGKRGSDNTDTKSAPTLKVDVRHSAWINTFMVAGLTIGVQQNWPPWSPDYQFHCIPCVGVHERSLWMKGGQTRELYPPHCQCGHRHQWRLFARSLVKLARNFIEAKGGHFEHLLQQWKSRVCKICSHCHFYYNKCICHIFL